jgi:rhodanese-related sulfurtransferase
MTARGYAGDRTPLQSWEVLAQDRRAKLVDCRTPAEWAFVGLPDLRGLGKEPLCIPWALFPAMNLNPDFMDNLVHACPQQDTPLFFLCRSGARSRAAAIACTQQGYRECYNIDTGFEGIADKGSHRGTVNGWKVDGLPWIQG